MSFFSDLLIYDGNHKKEISMDYINGGFLFDGYEDDIVFVYLWEKMIIDMSFWGRAEFILRVLFLCFISII